DLQTIERRKPPPPPPPKTPPPPPKLKVASDTPPQQSPLPFNIPNLGLNASVGGGPFIGEMGAGGGAMGLFDGDIIPLAKIAPQYPRQAARDGIEGYVKLEILVNPDGTVKSARVIEAKPRGVFDSAAVTTVLKWKFKPRVVDGRPVEQKGTQVLEFNLSGEE
ncbi:MAG TPA: energy transducer TonB, partial [Nevskiaceae bacterium]|nr:energy transducer TonB [Nevskiaceae bacterium]